jgi:hypothetical protein
MKNKIFLFLLTWILMLPAFGQFTFKLKSVVSQSNPSSNGLFSYGTIDANGNFVLFPHYANDNSGGGGASGQLGWTFTPGQQEYPFLAYEQLTATEITPQPFPEFGAFLHPGESPSVVKLLIPQNAKILYIKSNIQRATFGCGENVGYSIKVNNQEILSRTLIQTSSNPTLYSVNSVNLTAGDVLYFIVDKGDDGHNYCDDTALDVEISWEYAKIVTPKLATAFDCKATSITYDIDFQPSGTLSLYQIGNPNPIATAPINQVGVSYKGQATFTGLNLSNGGSFYAVASNSGQITSDASETTTILPCCSDAVAPIISVNNANICQGEQATLTVSGCTGTILWNNGSSNQSIVVNSAGTYTATCTIKATPPCSDASSTASGGVVVNELPTLSINNSACSTDLLTYSIGFSSNGTVNSSSGIVAGNLVSSIPIGTNVSITATSSAGCSINQNVNSPVCTCPAVNAPVSLGNKAICSGESIPILAMNVNNGETVDWYDAAVGGNLILSNSTTFTPTQAGTFYALARNTTNQCSSNTRTAVSLTIHPKGAAPIISASNVNLILGESSTLSIANCEGEIAWSTGEKGATIKVKPNVTSNYSATCTSSNTCVSGIGQITIHVRPAAVKIIGQGVCEWDKTTLTQSGCSTAYYWLYWKKNEPANIQKIENEVVSMVVNEPSYFKLVCLTTAGESIDEILIEPIIRPNKPTMVTDKSSYLVGEIAEVNALNCNGYLRWSNGQEGLTQIRVSPTQTTTYTAYCIGKGNCISENSIQVIVKTAPPQVQDAHICFGEVITLKSGCAAGSKGHWTENWLDLPKRIERNDGDQVQLFDTKVFAVLCEGSAGYSDYAVIKVHVHLPILAPKIQVKDSVIVKGDSLILTVPNCEQKTIWKHTQFQGNAITIKPEATSIYQARCQTDGCLSEETSFTVYVRPKSPQLKASVDTICVGNSIQITASNCEDGGKLMWLPNGGNETFKIEKPSNDTLYQVICIGLDGLVSDTSKVKIKVYPIPVPPTVSTDHPIIIEGERTILKAANCDGVITWNTGATGQNLQVSPNKNTIYTATCTVWQCTSAPATISIRVRPKPLLITDGKTTDYHLKDTLCIQKTITISVRNECNGIIQWSNGQTGKSQTFTASQNATYQVWCVNEDNEKSDESSIEIDVLPYSISDVVLYPNPTSGKLFIQSKGCVEGAKLRLFTQRGELLYEGNEHHYYLDSLVLDLYHLPSAEYILHISGIEGTRPVTLKKRVIKTNN